MKSNDKEYSLSCCSSFRFQMERNENSGKTRNQVIQMFKSKEKSKPFFHSTFSAFLFQKKRKGFPAEASKELPVAQGSKTTFSNKALLFKKAPFGPGLLTAAAASKGLLGAQRSKTAFFNKPLLFKTTSFGLGPASGLAQGSARD